MPALKQKLSIAPDAAAIASKHVAFVLLLSQEEAEDKEVMVFGWVVELVLTLGLELAQEQDAWGYLQKPGTS